jgi:hypothetical protein
VTSIGDHGARSVFGVRSATALLALVPLGCCEPEDDPPNPEAEPPCELEFAEEVAPVLDYDAHGPCNPLDPPRKPFRVQPTVAVARNPEGVLFVVDRVGGGTTSRVYTSVVENQLQWEVAPIAGISECDEEHCYEEYFSTLDRFDWCSAANGVRADSNTSRPTSS